MNFEAFVEFESQFDNKSELANLEFSTSALNFKTKKIPLGIKLLQDLPNGLKILQIYRMEHGGFRIPYIPL